MRTLWGRGINYLHLWALPLEALDWVLSQGKGLTERESGRS